jgi:hypothetical protein
MELDRIALVLAPVWELASRREHSMEKYAQYIGRTSTIHSCDILPSVIIMIRESSTMTPIKIPLISSPGTGGNWMSETHIYGSRILSQQAVVGVG